MPVARTMKLRKRK
jgi:hypothetical protein